MDADTRKLLIDLVDLVRDVNKTISMHIVNHNNKYVDGMCRNVMQKISDDLGNLTDALNAEQGKEKSNAEAKR